MLYGPLQAFCASLMTILQYLIPFPGAQQPNDARDRRE